MVSCSMVWCANLWYAVLWYAILWYDTLWYSVLWYAVLWYAMLWYATLWYDTLWYAKLWYAMLCYAMLHYGMLHYGMLCYDMLCYDKCFIESCLSVFWCVVFCLTKPVLMSTGKLKHISLKSVSSYIIARHIWSVSIIYLLFWLVVHCWWVSLDNRKVTPFILDVSYCEKVNSPLLPVAP